MRCRWVAAGGDGAGSDAEAARERIAQLFDRGFSRQLAPLPPAPAAAGRRADLGAGRQPRDHPRAALLRLRQPPPAARPRRPRHLLPRRARGVAQRGLPGALPLPRRAAAGGRRQRPSAEGRGALPRPALRRPGGRAAAPRARAGARRGGGAAAAAALGAGSAAGRAGAGWGDRAGAGGRPSRRRLAVGAAGERHGAAPSAAGGWRFPGRGAAAGVGGAGVRPAAGTATIGPAPGYPHQPRGGAPASAAEASRVR